ncbi:MAG: 16S rRNA (guanine(966)-N(2))-methyltransferase RsmD [Betaproteobacteria bacterium]|nr:16S rRNA (guanine(966)-N(2))-methyltransferase RsmD [Betaproteobacteria bacterium]
MARANRVRIIGGEWRSRQIAFIPRTDLRPTPDRVRETLFNWLGQDLTGKTCLDLFAGSGALGFEAASRGARRVVMVESDAAAFRALQASRVALDASPVELRKADALEFLRSDAGVYDVVFVDPPFKAGYWPRLAPLLPLHLAPGALVYHEGAAPPDLPPGWEVWRQDRAGQVRYQLLKRTQP